MELACNIQVDGIGHDTIVKLNLVLERLLLGGDDHVGWERSLLWGLVCFFRSVLVVRLGEDVVGQFWSMREVTWELDGDLGRSRWSRRGRRGGGLVRRK